MTLFNRDDWQMTQEEQPRKHNKLYELPLQRRQFLAYLGTGLAITSPLLLSACSTSRPLNSGETTSSASSTATVSPSNSNPVGSMYHNIVRNKLSAAFDGLNAGNIQAVLKELGDQPEHFFIGEHALGGTRHTKASIEQWYERLLQIFPDIHFTLNEIQVYGSPWNTVGLVYWTETNSGTDGVRTQNTGLNVIRIRWGKVVSIRIYTDTNVLIKTLDRLAKAGNQLAKAAPIVS